MPSEQVPAEVCFHEALSKPEGAERSAYLDVACAGDPELRSRVEALLTAHLAAEQSFLPLPAASRAFGMLDPVVEAPGVVIGPYRLLEQIGEGGFGVVFMAEQEAPIRRRVALKIIKWGMDTRQFIARFEAERQALALMDHPNVAKVFDAGATESGRPYFVMELVNGVPITDYCDAHALNIERRLTLFLQACYAVHHAHQKGLIHRDIKPGNILVTSVDDRPLVKVIDFGVAKATQGQLTEKTLFTQFRQFVGTPEYMSPEQAEATPDIDTRSDVYSLAVLLYQILTGVTPLDERTLRSKAYAEVQRMIREVDPPPPSTRVSMMQSLASVAASRSIEPRGLRTRLSGELDWIVMKALEKDRSRRYDSAAAFAADLSNHLGSRPVSAGAPSRLHLLQKFIRRNRRPVFVALAVLAVLLGGMLGTTIGLIGQSRLRAMAERERDEAQRQKQLAQANLAMALFNANEFTKTEAAFRELLQSSRAGPTPTAEERATWLSYLARSMDQRNRIIFRDRADAAFRGWLADRGIAQKELEGSNPEREPAELNEISRAYDDAIAGSRQVYPSGDTRIADIMLWKAHMLQDFGHAAEAEPLYLEALANYRANAPSDHIGIGEIIDNFAKSLCRLHRFGEAEAMLTQSIAEYKLGPAEGQWRIGNARLHRATALVGLGQYADAETELKEVELRFSGHAEGYQECAKAYVELYRAWDQAEQGRGHDRQAKEWEKKLLPNLFTFLKATIPADEHSPGK